MSSYYCANTRSFFFESNFDLSTECTNCKHLGCYHVDITNGICKNCYCLATPEDVIKQFHLLKKDKNSKFDLNSKCPCGHLLSDHSNASILSEKLMKYYIDLEHSHEDDDALLQLCKKTKREPVNINVLMNLEISQFNKISCLMEICDYLLFTDIVTFDSAFNNHEFRRSWTAFLKNKYKFRVVIIGYCLKSFSYIKKLLHFYVWLYKRNYKVCYIQMMTSIYDVDASVSEQYFKQMLGNNELANVFDGCKSLISHNSGKYADALYNITKISLDTFRSLEELDLRTDIGSPSRSIIDNDVTIIIKNCPMLSRISLCVYSDQVTGLCDSLNKQNKLLTMLDLEHPQDPFYRDPIVISSFYLLKDLPLETLHLKNYNVHNDDITILVNSCSHLHELHLIGITFDNKIISSWNSSSMKALTLRNCYYMKTEDMILTYTDDDYILPKAYEFRGIRDALHHIDHIKDTQDGTCEFKTITKLDFLLEEVSWPIYDSSFYDDFLLEFQDINFINLNYFDVSFDTLVNEKSLIREIIQKGNELKVVLLFNWHVTNLSLDSISENCPLLQTIFLCIDDLRMTELGLKGLIDNCKYLKCIIFYHEEESSLNVPDFKLLYYAFEDICESRRIRIKFSHDYKLN